MGKKSQISREATKVTSKPNWEINNTTEEFWKTHGHEKDWDVGEQQAKEAMN